MIEDKIIKHTRRAYEILKSRGGSYSHKVAEIIIELLIIISAVTISIWLNDWNEKKHEQKEEKEFLTGLKKDLQKDIENMESSKKFYTGTFTGINYFLEIGRKTTINRDSINKYADIFFSYTDLEPNIGRYEGLKSSNKMGIIENKELLNSIIDLHETIIHRIEYLNEKYYHHNDKLENLIAQTLQIGQNGGLANVDMVVNRSDFKILLLTSKGLIQNNIIPIHNDGIKKCKNIIHLIDLELK